MKNLTILKLGGSAITDKSKELTPDLVSIHRSADQVARFKHSLVLLHGGGSFAHPFASRAGLQKGYTTAQQLKTFAETELYLEQLSRIIMVALLQRNIPAVRVHPMSCIVTTNGKVAKTFLEPFKHALGLGILPVSHGDILFDTKKGFSILSADRLAFLIGVRFKASRVLFGSDVNGVFTRDPKKGENQTLIPEIDKQNLKQVLGSLEGSRASTGLDVTGGMAGKVLEASELARNGCETIIFNLRRVGALEALLSDNSAGWEDVECTRFPPWDRKS